MQLYGRAVFCGHVCASIGALSFHLTHKRLIAPPGRRPLARYMRTDRGAGDQVVLARPDRTSHPPRRRVRPSLVPRFRSLTLSASPQDRVLKDMDAILARLHVLVLGPGLGRETYMQSYARAALTLARERSMFVVLDADALWMLAGQSGKGEEWISLVRGYRRAVLTPNVVEFKRLCELVGVGEGEGAAGEVSRVLGGVVVLEKGARDVVASVVAEGDGEREVVEVDEEGGMRRCGGQGDVLSGCVGTMLAWGKCYEEGAYGYVCFDVFDVSFPGSDVMT